MCWDSTKETLGASLAFSSETLLSAAPVGPSGRPPVPKYIFMLVFVEAFEANPGIPWSPG